jgi:hypothetical protein
MTVRELIERLSKENPEAEAVVVDPAVGNPLEIASVWPGDDEDEPTIELTLAG